MVKRIKEIGRAKVAADSKSPEGLTVVQPFNLRTDNMKKERLKDIRNAEVHEKEVKKQASPLKSLRKKILLNEKLTAIKLFDVDVKISKDNVVRIAMTDKDDPWQFSKLFQSKYSLTNGATAALYEMLRENYEREKQKLRGETSTGPHSEVGRGPIDEEASAAESD